MITIHNFEQGSPEWHKWREGRWTGSKAIKLLQGKPMPPETEWEGNKYTRRGQLLELVAIREYTAQTGIDVLTVGGVENSKYPNAGYSPDGVAGDTLIEVKCLNGERHESLVRGEIPLEYLVQIYFGMVICQLDKAMLLAFNPEYKQQLTTITIKKNAKIMKNIRTKLKSSV